METKIAAGYSDHEGVVISLADPSQSNWIRTTKRVYPPPTMARTAEQAACTQLIQEYAASTSYDALGAWDQFKVSIRTTCLNVARLSHKQRMSARKRRLRRLQRSLRIAMAAVHTSAAGLRRQTTSVAQLAIFFENLSLEPNKRIQSLRNAISDMEVERLARQQQAVFERYASGAHAYERTFFQRFSVKQGPEIPLAFANANRTSSPGPRGPARDLARDWSPYCSNLSLQRRT